MKIKLNDCPRFILKIFYVILYLFLYIKVGICKFLCMILLNILIYLNINYIIFLKLKNKNDFQ